MKAPVNSGSSANKQIAPEGTHVARCYQIIDKGTTFDEKWQNRKRKIQFMFELPMELAVFNEEKGEQPFYVKTVFNLSMGEKASLRKFIESWFGKKMTDKQAADFEIFTLIGAACMINVVHNGKEDRTYANIMSISPMPKGMQCPPAVNMPMCYDTTAHDEQVFIMLPEFMQEDIKKSDEWLRRPSQFATSWSKPNYPTNNFQTANTNGAGLTDDLDALFGSSDDKNPF
jgi:hypothetical protein